MKFPEKANVYAISVFPIRDTWNCLITKTQ